MIENNRNPIEIHRKKLPQFTTMNVIDGQAGLINYSSLIFYSLTIDNILNMIVLLILAGVTIATLTGENGILTKATEASEKTKEGNAKEQVQIAVTGSIGTDGNIDNEDLKNNLEKIENITGIPSTIKDDNYPFTVTVDGKYNYIINKNGTIEKVVKREGIQIGDYVNYTYDTNSDGYNLLGVESGYDNDQAISQKSGMKWRILNIHENGTVDLIADIDSSDLTISFKGALGYNNGVYLLNDISKELYSNSSLGITARSINLNDIEELMNEEGKKAIDDYINSSTGLRYGETKTYGSGCKEYPNIYAKENGGRIDTEDTKTDGIGVSDEGYTKPTSEESDEAKDILKITQTYYMFGEVLQSYFKDYNGNESKVRDILFNTNTTYWLASRGVYCHPDYGNFLLRVIRNSNFSNNVLFNSSGTKSRGVCCIRPVVTIGSDIQITSVENPDGSSIENMHQISKK